MLKVLSFAILTSVVVSAAAPASACDRELNSFPRDCAIQDKFRSIRSKLVGLRVDIEEIAEYRAIRFIDRGSWEKAKLQGYGPRWIYKPGPDTWDTFDNGIRYIDQKLDIDDLNLGILPQLHVALINQKLVDKKTDQSMLPGQFRAAGNHVNGFPLISECTAGDASCENNPDRLWRLNNLKIIPQDNVNSQLKWEQQAGERFSDVVARANGPNPENAKIYSQIGIHWAHKRITYIPSEKVADHVQWFMIYKDYSLDRILRGQALQSPIQLSADLQRMMVGIHPFGDGNGRLSRVMSDLVLKKFDLPKTPSGDLINDVIALHDEYRANTYKAIESMLVKLEECVKFHRHPYFNKKLRMQCSTVTQLRDAKGDARAKK